MEAAIIGGLFAIVAALLGGLFFIYCSRKSDRRKAAEQLIAEFAKAEVSFNKIANSNVHGIDPTLRDAFPRLEEKVIIFKRYLFWPWSKYSFEKAWIAYYNDSNDERCQSYHHYMPFGSNPNFKDNFKHNVDNLLKFAKLT